MSADGQAELNYLCSGCLTPTPAAESTVIPRWKPEVQQVITSYRCTGCRPQALDDLRAAIASEDDAVSENFCDFLARRGYVRDSETIRSAEPGLRRTYLGRLVDAVESGALVFEP